MLVLILWALLCLLNLLNGSQAKPHSITGFAEAHGHSIQYEVLVMPDPTLGAMVFEIPFPTIGGSFGFELQYQRHSQSDSACGTSDLTGRPVGIGMKETGQLQFDNVDMLWTYDRFHNVARPVWYHLAWSCGHDNSTNVHGDISYQSEKITFRFFDTEVSNANLSITACTSFTITYVLENFSYVIEDQPKEDVYVFADEAREVEKLSEYEATLEVLQNLVNEQRQLLDSIKRAKAPFTTCKGIQCPKHRLAKRVWDDPMHEKALDTTLAQYYQMQRRFDISNFVNREYWPNSPTNRASARKDLLADWRDRMVVFGLLALVVIQPITLLLYKAWHQSGPSMIKQILLALVTLIDDTRLIRHFSSRLKSYFSNWSTFVTTQATQLDDKRRANVLEFELESGGSFDSRRTRDRDDTNIAHEVQPLSISQRNSVSVYGTVHSVLDDGANSRSTTMQPDFNIASDERTAEGPEVETRHQEDAQSLTSTVPTYRSSRPPSYRPRSRAQHTEDRMLFDDTITPRSSIVALTPRISTATLEEHRDPF